MKAIPATYKGITLRSQLEYDWARFFESERLSWVYEPETFREGVYSYTPDFLVEGRIYVETKGEGIRLNASLRLCPDPLIICYGPPRVHFAFLRVGGRLFSCASWDFARARLN